MRGERRAGLAAVALRTRVLLLALRFAGPDRLRAAQATQWGRWAAWLLTRGTVQVVGGLGTRLRLRAETVDVRGHQAYGVLTGMHELSVQEAMRRHLRPGDVVWDVGANVGMIALIAARLVGAQGRVVAFEPEPGCAAATRANAAANGFAHVEVREVAVARSTGRAELIVTGDRLWTRLAGVGEHGGEVGRLQVATIALDDVPGSRPALVKIDVEGAELDVLHGAGELLAHARPVVVCEMHGKNAEVCALLEASGYDVFNLDGPDPVPVADGNVHAIAVPRA